MDAFEIRMQFLTHLRRLTSAAQSINKVVSFLLKHTTAPRTSPSRSSRNNHLSSSQQPGHEDDLWECILEELEKASINAKINIFYMLDSLLDQSLAIGIESYRDLVRRDLGKVIDLTVPRNLREGVLNRMSSMQVLNSWKMRRLLPVQQLEDLLVSLRGAEFPSSSSTAATNGHTPSSTSFSRNDILRRIEDDRERHKRLRERIWVLPVPSLLEISSNPKLSTVLTTAMSNTANTSPESPASPAPNLESKLVSVADYRQESRLSQIAKENRPDQTDLAKESALDVEFEQAWDMVASDTDTVQLDQADLQAMEEENARCFGT